MGQKGSDRTREIGAANPHGGADSRMATRIVTPRDYDEWRPFDQIVASSFGEMWEEPKSEDRERAEIEAPYDFCIGVMDGDEVLGACSSFEFDLSLPGGRGVSVAALTAVGGNVTRTGRGALRAMMIEHLQRARERGHAASILNASEASIYGRFGYGHATTMVGYEVDSDRAEYSHPLDDPGSIELVTDLKGSIDRFRQAYDRCALVVPGTGGRNERWWDRVLDAKPNWRGGGKKIGVLHLDHRGDPDGYLLYSMKDDGGWVAGGVLTIRELLGADVTTELALFRFATEVPLQRTVRWPEGPIDFPARHHMVDPRQLHVIDQHDLLWLRPLDVAVLLESRTFSADDDLVLGVDDQIFEDQCGPWRLSIRDGAATVERTDAAADLDMTSGQLAMVLLGDHRVQELAHAGVLAGEPAIIRRFDRVFQTDRRPYNLSKF
jgi:predicted acetyltransferase